MSDFQLTPVKFSRLTTRGILLGLSLSQVVVLGGAGITFVAGLYLGGNAPLLSAPVWITLVLVAWVPVAGRKTVDWIPIVTQWWLRHVTRQTSYRRRITVKPRPAGTLALPGDASSLRQYRDPETGAVMVHDPYRNTLTVMMNISHSSFALLDPADQERRVHGWGRVLSTLCRSPHIARLQVMERTMPDSGAGLSQWWQKHGTSNESWASRNYEELVERAGPTGEQHVSTLALSLDMTAARRAIRSSGRGMIGAASVLRQEMSTLVTALRTADLRPQAWYTPGELAVFLRGAFDPAIAMTLERSGKLGHDLAIAGPVAVEESWAQLQTDSAFHAVFWISEWPRAHVYPGFLSPLLLTGKARRTFTLLMDPVRSDVAARHIRKAKVEHLSDRAQRTKMGQIEDATVSAEFQDVLQQEAELIVGHGVLTYSGFLSVSASSQAELESVCASVEQAAIQANCETRRLVGQQGQAFMVTALPLARAI